MRSPRRSPLADLSETDFDAAVEQHHFRAEAISVVDCLSTKLYTLLFNEEDRGQWFLGVPVGLSGKMTNPWVFTEGKRVIPDEQLIVPVSHPGHSLDLSFAAFDVPIVTERTAELLSRMCPKSIQRIPVTVESQDEPFEILNFLTAADCIDERRTKGTKWTLADGEPDKVGQYRMITELRVVPAETEYSCAFRVAGWKIALIVSGDVKAAMEEANISGLAYELVS